MQTSAAMLMNLDESLIKNTTDKIPISVTELMESFDWKKTVFGDRDTWSASLHTAVSIVLNCDFPALLLWGEDFVQIYNDDYATLIGNKHPSEFGKSVKVTWQKQNWDEISPILKKVLHTGKSYSFKNKKFTSVRTGVPEARYYNVAYSPVSGSGNKHEGIFVSVFDSTKEVNHQKLQKKIPSEYLKEIFINAPFAFCVLNGPHYVIEVANPRMLDMLGLSLEETLNKPFLDVIPEAEEQGYESLLEKVRKTGLRMTVEERELQFVRSGRKENIFIKLVFEPILESNGSISGILVMADEITQQVELRKTLEENETRIKVAIEAAAIGTYDWDIKGNTFNFSDRLAQIFGYQEARDLTQKSFADRILAEDQPIRLAAHKQAFETGILFYEARIMLPEQSIRWIKVNGRIIYDEDRLPKRMYGTAIDITDERSLAENLERVIHERTLKLIERNEALKVSEERYHKMVDEIRDYSIIMLDMNGFVQNWNKGAQAIKGYTEEEIKGKHFSIFYPEEDRKKDLPQKLLQVAIDEGRASDEGWRIKKDGTLFWGSITIATLHNDTGNIIGFSKVTRDLTLRKQAEDKLSAVANDLQKKNDALRESEERYHKMIAEVKDYAILALDTEGVVKNWNAGAEFIKGYKADEIVGKSFKEFYTTSDKDNKLPEKLLHQARTEGKATQEGWRVRKDGSRFWASVVITALHNKENKVIGFSKVTRDLTKKKEADDKLRLYTLQLESQNKELEQFAYVASHDLQEPLRKIQTFSELIRTRIPDDDSVKNYFVKIATSAQRMSDLIRSVLNYSKLSRDDAQFSKVDLNEVMTHVLIDLELLIYEKNAVINTSALPSIKADLLQMNQLFSNILNNALKFTQRTPKIFVSYRMVNASEVKGKSDRIVSGDYHEVAISDNGIGFESEYASKIFGMFQRLHGKQQYAGTGIGLALCKKIMENHNGFITADSKPGEGTTFFLYFPATVNREVEILI